MAIEYGDLIAPSIEVRNEKGEVIFALKRKDKYPPTYYLFEKHEDRMNDEEKQATKEAWEAISTVAGLIGFPLYDLREITDGLTAKAKAVMESKKGKAAQKKADETGEDTFVEDVTFKVFNHSTGDIDNLTVGVSARKAPDVGADNGQKDNQEAQ